jgi:hypothetical protein
MPTVTLAKYSMGIGDRFAHQGEAQLAAFVKAERAGVPVTPVWNKSNREHQIIGTEPDTVRAEADAAVKSLGWAGEYRVDADHIGLKTVDRFLAASDFYTIDVADFVGKPADAESVRAFVASCGKFVGSLAIPGIPAKLDVTPARVESIAAKYLLAVQEAGKIYRHIESAKGKGNFITEVSIDETDQPQTPVDLLFILVAIAAEGIPAQTIAPKFTGRFNKGVDYVGDLKQFEREFNDDLSVIAYAVKELGLPANLKLSVHSGSDKFSLYPIIRAAILAHDAGLHIKTAGTTWLEELIGLAESGGDGLPIAKECYTRALVKCDELCAPYATVIDIDKAKLPTADQVNAWTGADYAAALRHDQSNPRYNPHLRQLLHVGYKVAALMGSRYLDALKANKAVIAGNVTENMYDRHLKRVFPGA